ncbi:hypothetical protein RUM43_008686 [Polyplax serrata]|uniref:Uncharacterized protein n=1 Tax=Polyplax serrata TaxID=468196 RepID=A0AAN8P9P1_POLSC
MHTTMTAKKRFCGSIEKQNSRRTFTPLKKSRNEWNAPVEMLITSHPEFGTANPNRTLSPNSKVSRHPTKQLQTKFLPPFTAFRILTVSDLNEGDKKLTPGDDEDDITDQLTGEMESLYRVTQTPKIEKNHPVGS